MNYEDGKASKVRAARQGWMIRGKVRCEHEDLRTLKIPFLSPYTFLPPSLPPLLLSFPAQLAITCLLSVAGYYP